MVTSGLNGTIITVASLALHFLEFLHVVFAASGQTTYGSLLKKEEFMENPRRSVMAKKRDKKTKKRNVPDSSDIISIDGSTAPHGLTARGRTHLGGSPMELFSNRAISPPVTNHRSTSHRSISHCHQSSSYQTTRHQSPVNQAPVKTTCYNCQSPVIQAPVNQVPVI